MKLEIMKNKSQLEKLYILLGASIFIHYILVIFFCFFILWKLLSTGEYKKIIKDRMLISVEIVLSFSLVMSVIYYRRLMLSQGNIGYVWYRELPRVCLGGYLVKPDPWQR